MAPSRPVLAMVSGSMLKSAKKTKGNLNCLIKAETCCKMPKFLGERPSLHQKYATMVKIEVLPYLTSEAANLGISRLAV